MDASVKYIFAIDRHLAPASFEEFSVKRETPAKKIRPSVGQPIKPRAKPADNENWDSRLGFLMHDVSRLR